MLTKRGMKKTTLLEYQMNFDFPVINYYRKLGFDFEKESFDDVAREYINAYDGLCRKCQLRTGVIEIIKQFRAEGFLQSVLSASQQSLLEDVIDFFKLKEFFENIVGLDDYYARSKIEAGRNLSKNLAAGGGKLLLIGDTTHDYEVACQMNCDCVLLPLGHQSKERLIACGANVRDGFDEAFKALFYRK